MSSLKMPYWRLLATKLSGNGVARYLESESKAHCFPVQIKLKLKVDLRKVEKQDFCIILIDSVFSDKDTKWCNLFMFSIS